MRRTVLLASAAGLVAGVFASPALARPNTDAVPVQVISDCRTEMASVSETIASLTNDLPQAAVSRPGGGDALAVAARAAARERVQRAAPACAVLAGQVEPLPLEYRIEIVGDASPAYGSDTLWSVIPPCDVELTPDLLAAIWEHAPRPRGSCGQAADAMSSRSPAEQLRYSQWLLSRMPDQAAEPPLRGPQPADAGSDSGGNVEIDLGGFFFDNRMMSDWGLGTRIVGGSGGPEIDIVSTDEDMSFFGGTGYMVYELADRARIRFGGSYASGSNESAFSAPAGGSDLFGQTFLRGIGSGSSATTGLFGGNSFAVTARAEQQASETRIVGQYWFPSYGAGWRTRWGVGLDGEWYDESGEAEVAFTGSSSSSSPILNLARYELEARTIGAHIAVRVDTRAADFFIAGTATLGLQFRRSQGEVSQTVTCPPCSSSLQSTSLSESYDEDQVDVAGEIGAELAYPLGPITLTADVALRLNTGAPSLEMPDNPGEQPARFENRTVVQRQLRFGARYSF